RVPFGQSPVADGSDLLHASRLRRAEFPSHRRTRQHVSAGVAEADGESTQSAEWHRHVRSIRLDARHSLGKACRRPRVRVARDAGPTCQATGRSCDSNAAGTWTVLPVPTAGCCSPVSTFSKESGAGART